MAARSRTGDPTVRPDEQVLAYGESKPAFVRGGYGENRLSGRDDLAGFGHQQGHDAVDGSRERRLVQFRLDVRERRLGVGDLRIGDRPLLLGWTGLALSVSSLDLAEVGLGAAERLCGLVQLLLTRKILGCEFRSAFVLLLREREIGVGDPNVLRRRIDFLTADAGIDIGSVGVR